MRFGEETLEDGVEELMKIRQERTIEDYQVRFENVRIRVERLRPSLDEAYFLSVFVGGLKDDIRPLIRMLRPTTLAHAFQIAKFQEQFLNSSRKTSTIPNFH